MALIKTLISGNASQVSVWDSGTVPVVGDRIFNGGYNLTFDQNITIGASAASGQFPKNTDYGESMAFLSQGICTVTIKAGVTVRSKGDFLIHGGRLVMEEGSTLIIDTIDNPDAELGFYMLDIAANYGDDISKVKLETFGTQEQPCEIRREGSGRAWIEAGITRSPVAYSTHGSGCCHCNYTIFRNLGVTPHEFDEAAWNASPYKTVLRRSYYLIHAGVYINLLTQLQSTTINNVVEHIWRNCIFDNVTGINAYYTNNEQSSFKHIEMLNCRVKNTPWALREYSWLTTGSSPVWGSPSVISNGPVDAVTYNHPAVEGVRILQGNTFDREIGMSDRAGGWIIEGNVFCDGFYMYSLTPVDYCYVFKNNFIIRSDQWTVPNQDFPEFTMSADWRGEATRKLYQHYNAAPMEDYAGLVSGYMFLPYGTGYRDPDKPSDLPDINTWISGNYYLEDSSRSNPHYVQPRFGNGDGVHVYKDNLFEGVRVDGQGEFFSAEIFFDEPRTSPTYDTGCIVIVGTLFLPTAAFGTGGSINHYYNRTYPNNHSKAGDIVIGDDFVEGTEDVGVQHFGGYMPSILAHNTLFLGAGEGALNISEGGFHYDHIRYCKNNIFWDTLKRTQRPTPWAIGDVSGQSHPDTVEPLNVDYNLKINCPGIMDTTLLGNETTSTGVQTGHNTTKEHLHFNNNGYMGLELTNPDEFIGSVRRINAFGLNDVEAVIAEGDLPFVNHRVNAGFYAFSKSGVQSSTMTWRMIAKQYDYDDPDRSPDWTFAGLKAFIRGSLAPLHSVAGYNSPIDIYRKHLDPEGFTGGNPLGEHGHLHYAPEHPFNRTLIRLMEDYEDVGAVPFAPPNTPPVAGSDLFQVKMNHSLDLTYDQLLVNDADLDPQDVRLFVGSVGQAANGTVSPDSVNRTIRYTPNMNFFGTDGFTYVLQDSRGGESSGTVVIEVINQPPKVVGKTVSGETSTAIIIPKADLVAGSVDPEGATTYFSRFDQPDNGELTDGGDVVVYLSNPRFYGVDKFTFYIADELGMEAEAVCTVVVNPGAGAVSVLTDEERADLKNSLKLAEFLALQ